MEVDYAFTGGSIVGLLLESPELTSMRLADDVDIIVEVLSRKNYSKFEIRFRARGFINDIEQGAFGRSKLWSIKLKCKRPADLAVYI